MHIFRYFCIFFLKFILDLGMALKANYEFMFIGKDDNSFLESYCYDLFEELGEKSGQIFINVEVQNNPVDAEDIGAVIFEAMQKVFFEEVEKEPYERFEASLKAVNNVLKEFKSQKMSGYIGNLNVIIAAIVGDSLLLTQTGDAEAYLIRKKYVSVISEGLNEEAGDDIFSTIANGQIEAGDFVLFSSARLVRYISKTDLGKAVGRNLADSLTEIKDIVSSEILGRIGLTGIMFSVASKDEVKAIESEVDSATRTVLESSRGQVVQQKETLTGKFVTAIKGYRRKQAEVFDGKGRNFVGSVGGFFEKLWSGLFSKGFGKDKILAFLVVAIFVLSLGIWYANGKREEKAEIQKLDGILSDVQTKIAEAGTKGSYDKDAAKTILDQAYLDAMTVLNSGYYREKAKIYLVQIDETRDKLDNIKRVENPKVLADLTAKRSDVNALGFAILGDRVFVYEYNALYEVVVDQVQDPLTIDDKETVIAATGFDDRNSVVFLTKSGKLIEYANGNMSFMDSEDGSFHKATDLADWSNRIYLLDSSGNQIWKYTFKGVRDKFGPAEPYFSGNADIANAESFTIDSNIYMIHSNGDITKYYGGSKAEFYINNPPFNPMKDPKVVYTDEKLSQLFVVDSSSGKILVYNKDSKTGNLNYTNQYMFDGVGDIRDVYVDADSKKMYVLTATKILEVDL